MCSRDEQLKAEERVLCDANILVKDLQEQLQELKQSCVASKAAELFPEIKRLRKRVTKLRSKTKVWEQKRDDVRDTFKRIRNRAALGYKKKQLLDMIKDLRLQLSTKRENVEFGRMRHQLQVLFILPSKLYVHVSAGMRAVYTHNICMCVCRVRTGL